MNKAFTVLTKTSICNAETDEEKLAVIDEQWEVLNKNGIDGGKRYWIRFLETDFNAEEVTKDDYIDNAVSYLSAKEGIDLVRFEDGKLGFVGYYGEYRSGLEIVGEYTNED